MGLGIWLQSCRQTCWGPSSGPLHCASDGQDNREQVVAGMLKELPDGIGLL